jgi:hypothetical protein
VRIQREAMALVALVATCSTAGAQSTSALRQLPHGTCLALAAAGVAKNGAEIFIRPETGRATPTERAASLLNQAFDGSRPASGRTPCSAAGLTPVELQGVLRVLPTMIKQVDQSIKSNQDRQKEIEKRLKEIEDEERKADERRKRIETELIPAFAHEVAKSTAPNAGSDPKVLERLKKLNDEKQKAMDEVVKLAKERVAKKEELEKKKEEGTQLAQVRSELGELVPQRAPGQR